MAFMIYRLNDVIQATGLSRSSIYRLMDEGSFPRQINLGVRAVGWSSDDIDEWITSRVKQSN